MLALAEFDLGGAPVNPRNSETGAGKRLNIVRERDITSEGEGADSPPLPCEPGRMAADLIIIPFITHQSLHLPPFLPFLFLGAHLAMIVHLSLTSLSNK